MIVRRISSITFNARVMNVADKVAIRKNERDPTQNSLLIYSVGSEPHDWEIGLSFQQIEALYNQMQLAKAATTNQPTWSTGND